MAKCKDICRLCDKLIISTAVTFTAGALVIDIPDGTYLNGEKYCIVVAQAIPAETTINAPVNVTIGGDATVLYPLNRCTGAQALASGIRTRTKYSTIVHTTATGGSFRLLSCVNCIENNVRPSIP